MRRQLIVGIIFLLFATPCFAHLQLSNDPELEDSLYLYWTACSLEGLDFQKALDTMRLYVERHPFAIYYPGETFSALGKTVGYVGQLPEKHGKAKWITEYNWLVKVQPLNPDKSYLANIMINMAATLDNIDRNEAANMWYNYSILFPDSSNVAMALYSINSIRYYQSLIPEDTTPFHILHFPLQQILGVSGKYKQNTKEATVSFSPNPATAASTIDIELSKSQYLRISVYDLLGKRIREVASDLFEAGEHSLSLDLRDLSPGTYYVRLEYLGGVITKSLIVEH